MLWELVTPPGTRRAPYRRHRSSREISARHGCEGARWRRRRAATSLARRRRRRRPMRTARSERRSHYTRTLLVVPGSSDDAATQRSGRGNGRGEPAEGLSKYTMMSCLQRHVSTLLSSDTCPRPSRLATWPGGSPWISSVAGDNEQTLGSWWLVSYPRRLLLRLVVCLYR